jgi:hypothetical protein
LQKEFDQFKNNQLGEHTGQQANSLLGQMVEKQGQIVVRQAGLYGTMRPKPLTQQTARPLSLQKFERQEIEARREMEQIIIETESRGNTSFEQVMEERLTASTDMMEQIIIETESRGTSFEQVMEERLTVSTAKVQRLQKEFDQKQLDQSVKIQRLPQSSTTFQFLYVSDDSDRLGHLLDLLRGSKGHTLVFVKGDQRVKFLQEFLHRTVFDAFSKTTFDTQIL